jgi:hypothetical protein
MTDKVYTALDEPIAERLYEGFRAEWQKPINGRITVADHDTGSTVILDTTNELQHKDPIGSLVGDGAVVLRLRRVEPTADLVKLPVVNKPHLHHWVWCKSSS